MTKVDLAVALVPHLIVALPNPFEPGESQAKQVHEAAVKWAELIHAAAQANRGTISMFTLG